MLANLVLHAGGAHKFIKIVEAWSSKWKNKKRINLNENAVDL